MAAPTELYTLSLHDALPIFAAPMPRAAPVTRARRLWVTMLARSARSEEHTSELQSRGHLVCRLLLEKKNDCERQLGAVSKALAPEDAAMMVGPAWLGYACHR